MRIYKIINLILPCVTILLIVMLLCGKPLTCLASGYYDMYGNYISYDGYDDYGNYIGFPYYDTFGIYHDGAGYTYTEAGYYDIYGNYYAYWTEPKMSDDGLRVIDPSGYIQYVPLFYPNKILKDSVHKPQAELTVTWVGQYPELPNGCEIVSSAIVLNYLGFNVDKVDLAKDFFSQDEKDGKVLDFRNYYVGNPLDYTGLGCYASAVVDAVNSYLKTQKTELHAFNYTNYPFEELLNQVAEGNPVIIWVTQYMEEPFYGIREMIDDENIVYISQEHCLVLTGYDMDKNIVKVSDPLVGNTEYDMELFKKRFTQLMYQAVIIKTAEEKLNEEENLQDGLFNDKMLAGNKLVRSARGFDGIVNEARHFSLKERVPDPFRELSLSGKDPGL